MMGDMPDERLRPIERRVLALKEEGVSEKEIARRFRRTPRFIAQVEELATMDGRDAKRRRRRYGQPRHLDAPRFDRARA